MRGWTWAAESTVTRANRRSSGARSAVTPGRRSAKTGAAFRASATSSLTVCRAARRRSAAGVSAVANVLGSSNVMSASRAVWASKVGARRAALTKATVSLSHLAVYVFLVGAISGHGAFSPRSEITPTAATQSRSAASASPRIRSCASHAEHGIGSQP